MRLSALPREDLGCERRSRRYRSENWIFRRHVGGGRVAEFDYWLCRWRFTGQPVLAAMGLGADATAETEEAVEPAANALFKPMDGVFDPNKKRFYAEVGELLIAMPYRGATRHLSLRSNW